MTRQWERLVSAFDEGLIDATDLGVSIHRGSRSITPTTPLADWSPPTTMLASL